MTQSFSPSAPVSVPRRHPQIQQLHSNTMFEMINTDESTMHRNPVSLYEMTTVLADWDICLTAKHLQASSIHFSTAIKSTDNLAENFGHFRFLGTYTNCLCWSGSSRDWYVLLSEVKSLSQGDIPLAHWLARMTIKSPPGPSSLWPHHTLCDF